MLPNNTWALPSQPDVLIEPRQTTQVDPLLAYDNGPVELQDPSGGLLEQVWKVWVTGDDVYVSKLDGSGESLLFSEPGIVKVDLTFNQNGQPFIAYQVGDDVKIWWFDPTEGGNTSTVIAAGNQPFCTLDERRTALSGNSDIILIYERDLSIYWRQQRDRFLIEYETPLTGLDSCNIEAFGMGVNNRLTIRVEMPFV